MTKTYTGAKRGPKKKGLDYRYTILLDADTKKNLFNESRESGTSITEIGRQAIIDYLAAKERDRAAV
jgi:hypothetical protein